MTKGYAPPSHPNNNGVEDFSEEGQMPVDESKEGENVQRESIRSWSEVDVQQWNKSSNPSTRSHFSLMLIRHSYTGPEDEHRQCNRLSNQP
jgi:hypothetical protein